MSQSSGPGNPYSFPGSNQYGGYSGPPRPQPNPWGKLAIAGAILIVLLDVTRIIATNYAIHGAGSPSSIQTLGGVFSVGTAVVGLATVGFGIAGLMRTNSSKVAAGIGLGAGAYALLQIVLYLLSNLVLLAIY